MRIHVLSDLHTEFGPVTLPVTDADLVVLAGDIGVGLAGMAFARDTFVRQPVLYLPGNHEYYGRAIPHLTEKLRGAALGSGVRFLERDEVVIGEVRFLGCTLWTDFELFGHGQVDVAMAAAMLQMNDYRRIRCSPRFGRLRPWNALRFHAASRMWLAERLAVAWRGPTVVVTHHAPLPASIAPVHADDPLSASFASNLEELIRATSPALWIHGHTHHCVDFQLGSTRVISNQRGYPDEPVAGFSPGLVVDI